MIDHETVSLVIRTLTILFFIIAGVEGVRKKEYEITFTAVILVIGILLI